MFKNSSKTICPMPGCTFVNTPLSFLNHLLGKHHVGVKEIFAGEDVTVEFSIQDWESREIHAVRALVYMGERGGKLPAQEGWSMPMESLEANFPSHWRYAVGMLIYAYVALAGLHTGVDGKPRNCRRLNVCLAAGPTVKPIHCEVVAFRKLPRIYPIKNRRLERIVPGVTLTLEGDNCLLLCRKEYKIKDVDMDEPIILRFTMAHE